MNECLTTPQHENRSAIGCQKKVNAFVVDDCMDVVLGDPQLGVNVMLHYYSVCHDDVMNPGNGLMSVW